MSEPFVTDALWSAIAPLLPPEPPKPKGGRPRCDDKAYDHRRARSIKPRIARRGVERNDRLGHHRWVVERTLAWLNRFRRLTVRYERRADVHLAFVTLGCALICLNQIKRFY